VNDGGDKDGIALDAINGSVGQADNREFPRVGQQPDSAQAGKVLQIFEALQYSRDGPVCCWRVFLRDIGFYINEVRFCSAG
jgi:hypothetical protein